MCQNALVLCRNGTAPSAELAEADRAIYGRRLLMAMIEGALTDVTREPDRAMRFLQVLAAGSNQKGLGSWA